MSQQLLNTPQLSNHQLSKQAIDRADPNVKVIRLHPAQAEFRRSDARIRGFVGGIGSGKSWAGAYDLLTRTKPGRLYQVLSPTYRMLEDASWRTLKELARSINFLKEENKGRMSLLLGNGAEILGRTADDPERLRGPNISGAWLDEASLMVESTVDIILGRLRECGEHGWVSGTFTPRGKRHWTYRFFADSPEAVLFHAKTSQNPFLPATFATSLEGRYSPQFARQELAGEFCEIEGEEFPATWFENAWFERWPENLIIKTLALDPSKGRSDKTGDFSAYVKLGVSHEDVLYIQADLARRPIAQMVADGVEHYRQWEPHAFSLEGNAWQDLLAPDFSQEFRAAGMIAPELFLLNNMVNKQVRIRRLGGYLAHGRVKFMAGCPGTRMLVDQLLDFPSGPHDDGPDAMEMAIRIAEQLTSGE